ncbi:hypothetical protein POM88_004954 [Heracleum sosnowskyi]|uniref:Uncharacterized protein n=1 Tax=Heracleum sosnowskyi TaxID=360622 RepID=A0AAD8ND12_9APIA|nr:hypothetical protein POM88_004954 [Heracleum sosnowskyi]
MKKSGFFVAASAAVVSSYSSSPDSKIHFSRQEGVSGGYTDDYSCTTPPQQQKQQKQMKNKNNNNNSSEEKFAPRFDGLRFIETLNLTSRQHSVSRARAILLQQEFFVIIPWNKLNSKMRKEPVEIISTVDFSAAAASQDFCCFRLACITSSQLSPSLSS